MKRNPNRAPFPRASFLRAFPDELKLHPLRRNAKLAYFRKKNPLGYANDLGAQDALLDNMGLLICEQLAGTPNGAPRYTPGLSQARIPCVGGNLPLLPSPSNTLNNRGVPGSAQGLTVQHLNT